MLKKRQILIAIVSLGVLSLSLRYLIPSSSTQHASRKQNMRGAPAVTALTVQLTPWPLEIDAIGSIKAKQGIMVKAHTAGPITKIAFKSHQQVKAGQLLVQIYSDELLSLLQASQSKLPGAEKDYQRAKKLFASGNMSESALGKFKTNLDVIRADIAANLAKYKLSSIKAPFAGRLGLRKVSLGDYVKPGDDIVGLYDLSELYVDFSIPQQYLSLLHIGDNVYFTSSAYKNIKFKARVHAFNSHVNANTRTLALRATVIPNDNMLLPGMFVKVALILKPNRQVIAVPQTALNYSLYGDTIYKIIDGQAVRTTVKTGERQGNAIVITQGLSVGDQVITSGQEKIHGRTKVNIVKNLTVPDLKKPSHPLEH